MNWMHKYSYRTKIQVLLIIFVLLPCLLVSFISYRVIQDVITDKILSNNQQLLEIVASDLMSTIDDIAFASNYFVQEKSILESLNYMKNKKTITSYQDQQVIEKVQDYIALSFMRSHHLKSRMFIVTPSQFVLAKDSPIINEIIKNIDAFAVDTQNMQSGIIYWLDHDQINKLIKGDTYYYAARWIRHPVSGDNLGTLYIGLPSSYFENLLTKPTIGNLLLLDDQGKALIDLTNPLQNKSKRSMDSEVVFENVVAIPKTGWTLVFQTPQSHVTGEVKRVFYYTALLISLSISIFLLFSIFLAFGVNKPIQTLKRIVQKFGEGHRNLRYPVKGNDEIAILGSAFNQMLDQINDLIKNIEQEQEEKRVIELQALFSQIRPHFLINTLYAVKCSLSLQKDDYHSQIVNALMKLLRAYMRVGEASNLQTECTLLQDYVTIMRIKNEMDIKMDIRVPADLWSMRIPRLFLQPFVENAILHGFAEPVPNPLIVIEVINKDTEVLIRIKDNGIGMETDKLQILRNSLLQYENEFPSEQENVGLFNTMRRMKLTYGSAASMNMYPNNDAGLVVELSIPRLEEEDNL